MLTLRKRKVVKLISNFQPSKTEKEEQNKFKASRRKEIIMIRADINKIEEKNRDNQ